MINGYLFDGKYLIPRKELNDKLEVETGYRSFSKFDKYLLVQYYVDHRGSSWSGYNVMNVDRLQFFVKDDYGVERLLNSREVGQYFYSIADIRDDKLNSILGEDII